MRKQNAQGTTEYLIVIAIVVIIGLIIANLSTNLFDQTQILNTNEQLKGKIGTSGINIIDAIADYETEGILNLKNNSGETLTLTKITTEEGTQEYDNEQWVQGNTELININNLCQCETNQKTKTCNFQIHYTTRHGLTKKITQTITVNCQTEITLTKTPIEPIPQIENCFDSEQDPIQICTLTDLNRMREDLTANYVLLYDIDATETSTWNSGLGWGPIGTETTPFTGNFDGNNYTITGLTINRPETNYIGLFGYIGSNVNTTNLQLIDFNIIGKNSVGGIAGRADNITISNSYITGNISGAYYTGGFVGYNLTSTIQDSYNQSTIKISGLSAGGLIGKNIDGCTFLNSSNQGEISGGNKGSELGGLVGKSKFLQVYNSYNLAKIEGSAMLGGLAGTIENGMTISNSYNSGNINGIHDFSYWIGGLVGTEAGFGGDPSFSYTIENSYNTGNVKGHNRIGGIIGQIYGGHTITNSYNIGNITAIKIVGGIAGENESTEINNVYNLGLIIGDSNVGGIVGENYTNFDPDLNIYWDTHLTNRNNCYSFSETDSNIGCIATNNEATLYYGANGIPLNTLNWSTDIWESVNGSNPILVWQTE